MANYQSLKAAINAVIKANGNKEITGTVLNEVLLAMVNSLGAGYQFAGVATPDTNPGTPDQKVFYIASQAGTYTNFGGAVVSDGIAIFKWNGMWTTETLDLPIPEQVQSDWTETDTTKKSYIQHKPNIPPSANVDTVPTKDSPNAVSSGGVYDVTHGTLKTRYIPFDLRGESIILLSDEDMTELFGPATMVGGQSMFDLTVGQYQHIYRVTNSKSEVFEIPAAYSNINNVRKIVGINGNLTIELSFTITNGVYMNAAIAKRETSISGISYEEEQDLTPKQQVQAQNNMMAKAYAPEQNSGLGKVYLDKNNGVLTQSMMQATNTVYVIQYDYTMGGNITVPAGCTLEFDGGSISGDGSGKNTITGNSTTVTNKVVGVIFNNIVLAGSFVASQIFADWFSDSDDYRLLSSLFKFSGNITLSRGKTYSISNGVVIGSNTSVDCNGATIAITVTGKTAVFIARATTVEIYNGSIIGNGITAESNEEYGIYVLDSKNVNITDMYISAFSRDGIYIGYVWNSASDTNHIQDIFIRRCVIDAVARNGVSVASGDNVLIDNCTFKNITSFAPEAGVDVEPETGVSGKRLHINNVNITNCKAYNCGNSVQVYSAGFTYDPGSVFIDNLHAELNCKLSIVNAKPNAGLSTFVNNVTFVNPSHNAILVRNPSDACQVVLNNIHVSGYVEKRSAAGISYEDGNYGMITIFAQKNTGSTDRTDIGGINISNVFLSIKDGGALFDNIIAIGYQAEEYSGGQHIFTPLPIKNVRINNINAPEVQVKKNGYVSVKNMLNTSKYALTQNTLKCYHPASAWRRVAIINGYISFRANIQAVYTDYASQAFTADVSIQSFASSIVLSNNVGGNQIDSVRVVEEDNVKYLEVHNNKTGQIQYFITYDQPAADAVMGITPTAATETETVVVTKSFEQA